MRDWCSASGTKEEVSGALLRGSIFAIGMDILKLDYPI